ncbi:hypothetical protein PUNSTDRAFT_108873 [Punctularia strigosozonata HHB-11173 SS5]|uniref:D-isomer specific 2-hydroxyacid dehydrogenase NAD-binding domain-containing protein n=1 Tax=Punctularia strigosozonata (strain HHB-11173) TaxID=741275 RepID=R7S2E9_PUNST|nr:uncharacterized protein PUNSTDRAFT_108873 [Punctularia strigosozonata HHB-11173 SS5]EIN04029.1 hypothetical protein PUNSTDRAFT_108873 [Punctularia strigosozonata HHB-11173 SS5]
MGALISSQAGAKPALDTLLATSLLTPDHRERLRPYFREIVYLPGIGKELPDDVLRRVDVVYGLLPPSVDRPELVPRLKLVQLTSAGADRALENPLWKSIGKEGGEVVLTTAAGVHVGPIPQWFIATTLSLYHKLHEQILITHVEKRWPSGDEFGGPMFVQELRGKTVGVLGYGHIGREAARLAKAFGADVLAANSDGKRKRQEGYIVPGTGDVDGSIPSAYYSTTSASSFASFLAKSDVVFLSLPSTPSTRYIMNEKTIAKMKPSAILVNIGRGDLVDTSALVRALDTGIIAGAALDVTDPEPLPPNHTLYGRKNVIITPHLSGRTVKYFDLAVDILVENLDRIKAGKELVNRVDLKRGY